MSKRNLNVKSTIHKFYFDKLKDPKIKNTYKEFKRNIELYPSKKYLISVSGGPDSLALVFLSKIYSIEKNIKFYYLIIDHKIRTESTKEAALIKKNLKKYNIDCKILKWIKNKKKSNIQSRARDARYNLITKEALLKKTKYILTAHHSDDLFENFFIRLLRGSGLKGLSSFSDMSSKINKNKQIFILRPLLNTYKKDLLYIAKNTFHFFINDPSNNDNIFLRVKIRKLLTKLKNEGLNTEKLKLTLNNLQKSNLTINYFVKANIDYNTKFLKRKNSYILNMLFFDQPEEIIFRSISKILIEIGKKKNYARGKKITNLINHINSNSKFKKTSLSGCILEKINNSIVISRET